MMTTGEIVSRVVYTAAGFEAWVEQDRTGQLAVRCTGCRTSQPVAGMAPGLNRLVRHTGSCTAQGEGRE